MRAPLLSRSHRRRSQREFSPKDISGLQLWFDFSDPITLFTDSAKTTLVSSDGDVIGAVVDKSGKGKDATQATTANKPLYKTGVQNSLSSCLYDGADDYLSGAFTQLSQPYNVIVVAQMDVAIVDDDNVHTLLDGDEITKRAAIRQDNSESPNEWDIAAATSLDSGIVTNNNWNLFFALYNGASSNLRINGSSVVTGDAGVQNIDGLTIGSRFAADPGSFWKGFISEILIYDSSLLGANVIAVENYLNNKWAIF